MGEKEIENKLIELKKSQDALRRGVKQFEKYPNSLKKDLQIRLTCAYSMRAYEDVTREIIKLEFSKENKINTDK